MNEDMRTDIEKVLLTEEEIREKVTALGRQVTEDYRGKNLMLVSVLKGSIAFMADLMRAIDLPLRIDFLSVSSYGSGTDSSGTVTIKKGLDIDLTGVDLLIVEDILDSGLTLSFQRGGLDHRRGGRIGGGQSGGDYDTDGAQHHDRLKYLVPVAHFAAPPFFTLATPSSSCRVSTSM